MRLGEILRESGILNDRQLANALEYSHNKLIPLGQVVKLLRMVPVGELEQVYRTHQLIRRGMPSAAAMNVLNETLGGQDSFEEILKAKLESENILDELRSKLLSRSGDDDEPEPETVRLDAPTDELLRLGDQLFDEEYFRAAEQCFNTLRKRVEASDGASSDTLTPILRRLANLYMVTGRFLEAEGLCSKILQTKQSIYGRHHVSVALAFEDLADLQYVQKEYMRAQNLYLSASSVHEKYLPASLAEFVGCLKKLLACSRELEPGSQKKRIGTLLTEANLLTEEQLQKALKYAKQEKMPLGAVLRQECMIDEKALQSFLEVQALIADGVLSGEAAARAYKGSVLSGIPLKKLLQDAGLLESLENENKNLRLNLITELDELIAAEQGLGPNHREVAARAIRVGNVHVEFGNLVEAEHFYQRALNICKMDRKGNAGLLASASKQLGMVLVRSERALKAEPLFMEALDLLQATQQAESKDALEVLQELSLLHFREKNYAMCWNFFTSAMALACTIKSIPVLSADFLDAFNHCAVEVQHETDVEATYMHVLRTLRKSSNCDDQSLSLLNMKLGDFYRDTGLRKKARAQYEIAMKMLSRSAKPGDQGIHVLETRMAQINLPGPADG
jgi:tetratricopeptide (TPR) repeat protein